MLTAFPISPREAYIRDSEGDCVNKHINRQNLGTNFTEQNQLFRQVALVRIIEDTSLRIYSKILKKKITAIMGWITLPET